MLYRVQQFILAITASLEEADWSFIKTYLSTEEISLFKKLKVYEQKHCLNVAMGIKKGYKGKDQLEMIRAGLLHDIGKIEYPLNPIEKSIIVLLNRLTKGKVKKLEHLKMVKCYYHHAELGYKILKEKEKYSEEFLKLIREHHTQENAYETLKVLQYYDNQY